MMKKSTLLLVLVLAAGFIGGCGTVKRVSIESNPQNALIMTHEKENVDDSFFVDYRDPTPGEYRVNIWGKEKKVYVTAEKRGYKASTQVVTKETGPRLSFDLERIEGVPEKVFEKENLAAGTFGLLPVDIEVLIYSGAGNVGKKKFSAEKSGAVTDTLFTSLLEVFKENDRVRQVIAPGVPLMEEWGRVSGPLKDFVTGLNIRRLGYYGLPPLIDEKVEAFGDFRGKLVGEGDGNPPYLLYIWGKCVSETKGRKAANLILGVLGGAMSGIYPYMLYDPSAFEPRSGTLVVFYVIDAVTSEVLYIEPRYFRADISKAKGMEAVVGNLSRFPDPAGPGR